MNSDSGVRLEYDGPVATVTLCRPDVLNAQTPVMWRALRNFSRELPGSIRVVLVQGEGRAFSAGLDRTMFVTGDGSSGDSSSGVESSIIELARLPEAESADRIAGFQEAFTWLRRPDLVSVAAVQGHAIGAGFQLALNCDLRVLAADAQLAMAEVSLGLVPDLGGTKRLVELVGYGRALEICATARSIDAAEAARIGLANAVVSVDRLSAATRELADGILAQPRDAVVEIKALLLAATNRTFDAQDRAEREAQVRRLRDLTGRGE
jgi:enoyl-CoA hydratase/carnithine racemase